MNARDKRGKAAVLWPIQEGRCIHCREQMGPFGGLDPEAASLEHFLTKAQGGCDRLENLALAHKRCNEARGKRPPTPAHYVAQARIILAIDAWRSERAGRRAGLAA